MNLPERKSFNKYGSYALAVLSEMVAPALRLGARLAVRQRPSPPAQWKRALVVGDTHIGDLLYRTCSLERLKHGLPQCKFYYLTSEGVEEVLAGNPALDGILPLRNSDRLTDLKAGAWEHLKNLCFDAILCTNAVRGWPELLFAMKLGIPNRVAYGHRGLSALITHPINPRSPQPFPRYFSDMVSGITGQSTAWPLRPIVYPDIADREEAEKVWRSFNFEPSEKTMACFVTTRQSNGTWPVEWFGEVLKSVQAASGCRIVLCGAGHEDRRLEEFRKEFKLSAEVNAGLLGLRALVVFLSKCRLIFTQDSGPRHLGNAAAVPVVFLRNTWAEAIETGVYCETEVDLIPPNISRLPVQDQSSLLKEVPTNKGVEVILSLLSSKNAAGQILFKSQCPPV